MNGWPKLWSGGKSLATFGWNFMKVSGLGFPCCHITMQRAKSEQVRKCRACLYLVLFFLLLTLTRVGRQQYQSLSVFSCCGYCFVPALFCRHTPRQLPDVPSYIFTPLVVTVAMCSRGAKPCISKQSVKSVLCFFHVYIFYFNRCSFFWVSLSVAWQQTQVAGGWEGKGTPWAAVASHSHWEAIILFKIWIWYPCLGCNANDWVHVRSVL